MIVQFNLEVNNKQYTPKTYESLFDFDSISSYLSPIDNTIQSNEHCNY